MASPQELSAFLAGIERRAWKLAVYAVRDEDAALDIVQDAMMKLAERYGDRSPDELGPLFHRILQNRIHDHFRRQKVRGMWETLMSALGRGGNGDGDEADDDPLERLAAEGDLPLSASIEDTSDRVAREQVVRAIEQEVAKLPARQREAFLLRYWEDLDVSETAAAMGCSEGSVKTHCSRATHALAAALRSRGIST